jgi:hypothetical protein
MFPKMGKTFPNGDGKRINRIEYQAAIAAALKRELGGSHRAIKTVMRWTGVSERTSKNWIAGFHGPAGEHLIELLRNSDEVVATVLSLSARTELQIAADLQEARETLLQALGTVDALLEVSGAEPGENE